MSVFTMRSVSSLIFAAILLLAPMAVLLEHSDARLWQERLLQWGLPEEPNRHTPVHTLGTFLPPEITADLELTAEHNPVIITGQTRVPAGVRLTLHRGTHVFIHEYGQLSIAGELQLTGSHEQPVIFTSNEEHLQNRTWNGILLERGGRAEITQAVIRYGSPAVSCLPGSVARLAHVTLALGSMGLFTESEECALENSRILGVYDGVVGVGAQPQIINTDITAEREEIRYIENAF